MVMLVMTGQAGSSSRSGYSNEDGSGSYDVNLCMLISSEVSRVLFNIISIAIAILKEELIAMVNKKYAAASRTIYPKDREVTCHDLSACQPLCSGGRKD